MNPIRLLTRWLATLGLLLALAACANGPARQGPHLLPGGVEFYSFGIAQSKENFANIKRAQTAIGLYADDRMWSDTKPVVGPARISMIRFYFPFSARWELKDGRQFQLENIDVRSIMQAHFENPNNDLLMPWQREGRPKHDVGDYYPSLVYEFKDDALRLKWLLTINRTPVDQRILPSGAATPWDLAREEYLVTEIKGRSVQGIDFSQQWEVRQGINREK